MYIDRTTKPEPGAGLRKDHWSTDSIVGHWAFNERGGLRAYDLSGNDNDGQVLGPTWVADGLNFPGSTEHVNLGDMSEIEGQSQLTIVTLVRPNLLVQDYAAIFGKQVGSTNDITLSTGGAGLGETTSIMFIIRTGANTFGYTSQGQLAIGEVSSVIGVFDGTESGNAGRLKIYINGQNQPLTFNGTIPATTVANAVDGRIGSQASKERFNGNIFYMTLYNRALSDAEVAGLFQNSNIAYEPAWLPDVVAGGTTYFETPSDIITIADAPVKSVTKLVSDTLSLADSTAMLVTKILSDTISITEAPALTVQVSISDAISIADAVVKSVSLIVADAVLVADTTQISTSISVADAVSVSESVSKSVQIAIAESVSISEVAAKTIQLVVADGIAISESVVTVIIGVAVEAISDIVVLSDSVVTLKISGAAVKDRKEPIDRDTETIEWHDIIDIERDIDFGKEEK